MRNSVTAQLWDCLSYETAQLWDSPPHSCGRGSCETAWLGGGPGSLQLDNSSLQHSSLVWSALPCSTCSSPLWSGEMSLVFHLQCFSSSQENAVFSGKRIHSPRQRGADLNKQKSRPWPLIGLFSCKWGLQIFAVWLVQNGLIWLVRMKPLWLVGEDPDGGLWLHSSN